MALGLYHGAGIAPHHVLGVGEETIDAILGHTSDLDGAGLVLIVLLAKMVTTGLTITTGGSAGLLVPSMVLGGLGGALTAHGINASGIATLDPALFAVVGIASSLVAVVGVRLAAIALVFEVFGRVFGPPAILACGLTYLVTLKFKVYEARHALPIEDDPTARELTSNEPRDPSDWPGDARASGPPSAPEPPESPAAEPPDATESPLG